jgi:Cytidylate kinase-like family
VICISRVTGAGGKEIGLLVAEKLGFRYLDDEIIAAAATKGGVSPADVEDAERRKSLLSRVLDELGTGLGAEAASIARVPPVTYGRGAPAALQLLIVDVVQEMADQGNVVIAAHGASFALAGRTDALRAHVTSSLETRAKRLSESGELDPGAAAKAIRDEDRSRADYLRRFYGVTDELPTHYDLVVNTDRLSDAEAADLVVSAAS